MSREDTSSPPPAQQSGPFEDRATWERRIAYFMLVRLVILAVFTVLAGALFYSQVRRPDRTYGAFVWTSLILGYALTIFWARALPRTRDLARFASVQTGIDILLSAVVVQMTGGVDSGFVTLYLISVLGAAIMGGSRHTWAAAGACLLIYLVLSVLESVGAVIPIGVTSFEPLSPRDHWLQVARTAAGIVGVSVLSSYLNAQLTTSASHVERLRTLNDNIVRSLNSGLLTIDFDGRLLYFNPTARAILDLDDEQVGDDIETILPGFRSLGATADQRHELQLTTALGRRLSIGLSQAELLDNAGDLQGYVLNFQDLTRLHELAQQVRRHERLAALGGLAASVAHEIRNPLAAISGSAELLSSAELADEDERLLAIIRRESTRLSDMITDLLAFTRPRPPERRVVSLDGLVAETCEAFRADRAASGVSIETDGKVDVMAEVDGSQIRQVLWNLLRNAAEATHDGGRVFVQVFGDPNDAFVVVQDDGEGIGAEHLESIFDPFFTTKEAGTGFGLAIVHRIVEDNGGTISATSTPGEGAKFTVRFPRRVLGPTPGDSGLLTV